jgi:hypothetical protein
MTAILKALALVLVCTGVAALGACGGIAKPPLAAPHAASPSAAADTSMERHQSALPAVQQIPSGDVLRKIVPLDQMRGLTDGQITEMMGRPQFLRHDSAVELWQYRGDSCVLHLFLYRDNDALRVRHAELRPRTVSADAMKDETAAACLTKLKAAPPAATG